VKLEVTSASERALALRVEGYEAVAEWELRTSEGTRINQGKLFERHKGLLTLKTIEVIPSNAQLYIRIATEPQPMTPVRPSHGWLQKARRWFRK
jgi:hypothetical protein